MAGPQLASLAFPGQMGLEMELDDNSSTLQPVSHSSPKHHRTSSLLASPGGSGAAESLNGSTSSSLPGSQSSSLDGGVTKKSGNFSTGITLELPEFASMLPSECSFSESAADDAAAAPTPHTPVVLSVFEGDGLKAVSARAMYEHIWEHHQETDDEFAACFHDLMSQHPMTAHDWQSSEHFMQAEAWPDEQFPSLLSRRTLSAVMEGEHEGQDDADQGLEQHQHQQHSEQQHQQADVQQPGGTMFLLDSRQDMGDAMSAESICSESNKQPEVAAGCTSAEGLDEADVALELSSSSVVIHPDRPEQHQQLTVQADEVQQPSPQTQQQSGNSVELQGQEQQQQQQQFLVTEGAVPGPGSGLETMESADLPAVELRISSKHSCEEGKCTAAADAGPEEDEWQQANKQRLLEQQAHKGTDTLVMAHLAYPAAEAQLLAADMRCHRAAVLQSLPRAPGFLARKLQQLFSCGSCSTRSMLAAEGASAQEQVVLLLSLAKMGFSDADQIHVELLQSVYTAYTGKPGPAPRYGAHWCEVGFQGNDPATDLRGVGMLGLLQLLYLPHHDAAAAQKVFQLSVSAVQEFPLAIVGLNITRWVLTAIRAGSLTRAAHRLGSYTTAANHFYCGAFYEFYARWCQGKTMREAGFVLKHLEEFCRKHPAQLLKLAAAPDTALAAADSKAWLPS